MRHPSKASEERFRRYQTMALSPTSAPRAGGTALSSFTRSRREMSAPAKGSRGGGRGWGVINGGYEGEPFEIEMRPERQPRRQGWGFFSHINMCLSGPSSPSGGGPQHQMEPSLACVSPASTCHEAGPHFPLSSAVIYLPTLGTTRPSPFPAVVIRSDLPYMLKTL